MDYCNSAELNPTPPQLERAGAMTGLCVQYKRGVRRVGKKGEFHSGRSGLERSGQSGAAARTAGRRDLITASADHRKPRPPRGNEGKTLQGIFRAALSAILVMSLTRRPAGGSTYRAPSSRSSEFCRQNLLVTVSGCWAVPLNPSPTTRVTSARVTPARVTPARVTLASLL